MLFDGIIGSLIESYQKHRKSPFRKLRYKTSIVYGSKLRVLKDVIGKVCVSQVTFESCTSCMIGHVR